MGHDKSKAGKVKRTGRGGDAPRESALAKVAAAGPDARYGRLVSAGAGRERRSGARKDGPPKAAAARVTPVAAAAFPPSWSQYARLLAVAEPRARAFYEAEAIRGGWSVRQLDRQISTQFFERTAGSADPQALLERNRKPGPHDALTADEAVRDPYLLEFLNLKDEYGESDLEEALIRHLESFLLELGAGFTFVARQKRIRVGGRVVSH